MLKPVTTDIEALKTLDERLRWLSAWTIHNANHIRESGDGLKVGGHQASCASMTAIMAALYFHALGPNDRVAVKPHAGPVLHAIHYLLGSQSREQLENFRGFGGAQSYPSRTKDRIPVDFSTGSVGLGVAITAFASLVQDYLIAHGLMDEADRGRFVALMGDAELDEGNIYEALIEGDKHDIRNLWWIVDYNRQSLDATSADRMFERFDEIFRTCGWRVVELRYGKRLKAALEATSQRSRPGSMALGNAELSALHYQGGAALADADRSGPRQKCRSIPQEQTTMRRWRRCSPTSAAIAWKRWSRRSTRRRTTSRPCSSPGRSRATACPSPATRTITPGLMNPTQMAALARSDGRCRGRRVGAARRRRRQCAARRRGTDRAQPHRARQARPRVRPIECRRSRLRPARSNRPRPRSAASCSSSPRPADRLADRIVTTSPDVTVSTNLGAWVNQRGLFRREGMADVFASKRLRPRKSGPSANKGQHIELGIAENNLFLMLAAAGLSGDLFGQRLVADRHALRSLHRPRPRCAELRLLPGRALPAGRDAERHHARARKAARTSRSTRR